MSTEATMPADALAPASLEPVRPIPRIERRLPGALRRRPTDGVRIVVSILVLWWSVRRAGELAPVEDGVVDFLQSWPSAIESSLRVLVGVFQVWLVIITLGVAFLAKQFRLVRDLVAAGVVAWLVATGLDGISSAETFPYHRAAIVVALVTVAAPHLRRPVRRATYVIVLLTVIGGLFLNQALPVDVIAGLAVGWGSAAIVLLVAGAPPGRPTRRQVQAALADLGVDVDDVVLMPSENGTTAMQGFDHEHRPVFLRVLGRDEGGAQYFARLWRTVIYSDGRSQAFVTRKEAVEHEGLTILLAQRAGVRTGELLAAGMAGRDIAVLAIQRPAGTPLFEGPDVDDETLDGIWHQVHRLQRSRLSHGQLSGEHLLLSDTGEVQVVNFGRGTSSSTEDRLDADVAEALVTAAILAGGERAIASVRRVLGDEALERALPFVQPAALSPETRHAIKAEKKLLDTLRTQGSVALGVEPPKLQRIQRISWKTIVVGALLFLAVNSLLSQLTDPEEMLETLKSAQWQWVLVALFCAMATRVPDGTATLGSVREHLPFGPTVELSAANWFTNLAVPSYVGQVAVTIRYFQRNGIGSGPAISSGVLVGFASFLVQVTLAIVCLIIVGRSITPTSVTSGTGLSFGWVLVGILVVAVVGAVLYFVPKLRHAVVKGAKDAFSNLASVARVPRKLAMLFGGNLGSQLLFALCLGASLQAFGESVGLATLILVNTFASVLAGVAPVPGGIGVAEAGLTAGLTAAGVDPNIAVPAVLVHRFCTFWVTPIPGFIFFRRLTKRGLL